MMEMEMSDDGSSISSANSDIKPLKQTDKTPLLKTAGEDVLKLNAYTTSTDEHVPTNQTGTCYVYVLTFFAAIGGFLFGYDTGVVSGAMLIIRDVFHLNSFWQELIVSATIGAAAVFAVVGGVMNDYFGRKPTTLVSSLVFSAGAVLLGVATNKTMLLIGRIIVGIGIGLASMTAPMYIAESAPIGIRGRLVTLNTLFITGGQFVASLVDGAFSYDLTNGWRFMLGFAAIPSVIQFIGFVFMPESPRWLVQKGQYSKAKEVLVSIRGTADVDTEIAQIKQNCEEDRLEMEKRGSRTPLVIQVFQTPEVRRAVMVGCCLQMFQQLSGINTVMYYSATIITMSGVRDRTAAIWLAAVTSSINFLFTFVGLYLVERIGRRTLLLGSLAGTILGLVFLGVGFQLSANHSPDITFVNPSAIGSTCSKLKTCDQCMNRKDCGFCYIDLGNSSILNATCLPTNQSNPYSSTVGLCNSTELPQDIAWAYNYCPTPFSWMAIVGLVAYLAFFAPGMGPMPWTINSEIYPLWARSTGASLATATNWLFNLLISMTFLTLTEALTRYGAFYLYAGLALIGFLIFYFILPETKGKSLEEVQHLFKKSRSPCC